MSKVEFKDLDDAVAKFVELQKEKAAVDGELKAEKLAHEQTKKDLETEKKDHEETQKLATEAIEKFNAVPVDKSKVFATVKSDKYEIIYGVDGLTKEELAKDTKKLEHMIKIGSGALVKVEGK